MVRTRYFVVSWVDHQRLRDRGTREYGQASTKQAAIRLAERMLPPDADYLITTVRRTVHHGRTPPADHRRHGPTPAAAEPRAAGRPPRRRTGEGRGETGRQHRRLRR